MGIKKLITRYRNYLFLNKALKQDLKYINMPFLTHNSFRFYRNFKKSGCERNLAAAVIKKYRIKYPYSIKGWTKNEKIYKEYFNLPSSIKSLQEVKNRLAAGDIYVTMFRGTSYYKGTKDFEYCSCGTILREPKVYKIIDYREKYNSFRIVENGIILLNEEWMTAFKYSSSEEIKQYKIEESRRNNIQSQIKEKQKEIENLYKKL